MKKLLILLTVIFCSLSAYAQEQKIRFPSSEMMTVEEIIKIIEKQTGFSVAYNEASIDRAKQFFFDSGISTVSEVFRKILNGTEYSIKVQGKIIAVVHENIEHIYTGVVRDDLGPVIGAVVMIPDNPNSAQITDIDGRFSIKANEGNVLKVTIMGYKEENILLGSKVNELDILLKSDVELLEEVVVVGYGVQKKVNLTGSVSVVDSEDLVGRTSSNTSNLLVGAVPNMNVTASNGRPGQGSTINIRGVNSISSSTGPYVLIDGVEGSIDRVNPNDIESISMLKDASSAAIYGAKAAYGVILITTKSGADGNAHVEYNGRFTFHSAAVSTDFETRGYYSAALVDMFYETYQGVRFTNYDDEDYYQLWIRRNDKTEHPDRPWTVIKNGQYYYYANMDWYNYFFDNTRPTNEHNVSVYGGNSKLNYRISAGYYHQDGVLRQGKGDSYTRYNVRTRLSS